MFMFSCIETTTGLLSLLQLRTRRYKDNFLGDLCSRHDDKTSLVAKLQTKSRQHWQVRKNANRHYAFALLLPANSWVSAGSQSWLCWRADCCRTTSTVDVSDGARWCLQQLSPLSCSQGCFEQALAGVVSGAQYLARRDKPFSLLTLTL